MIARERGRRVPILLVEDDPEDVEIARRAFKKGGFADAPYVVRDGEEAMEFLQHTGRYSDSVSAPRPGLILLDLNLPELDGQNVLKLIKEDEDLRRIPVVVLTTSSEEADVLGCYDSGANTYITKPVEFDKLLEALITLGEYWLCIAEIPDGGQKLKELSGSDELTRLADRKRLMLKLEQEVIRAAHTSRSLGLLMIDLGNFKQVNERYGHERGDEVLKQCAAALRQNLRRDDFAARYGGEEFCVLLPEAPSGATLVAERLRGVINALPDPVPTISVGVAFWEPHGSAQEMLRRADDALQKAKEAGRDRVVLYG